MTVFALQFDIAWEAKVANFSKVRQLLSQAAPRHGALVVLPEMFATGFSMNTELIAEPYGGETERYLAELAKEFGVWLVAGAAMRGRDGQPRNKALVFSPAGELAGFYTKMRPFSPGGEAQHYIAGERIAIFRWQDLVVSPFICYDLRFPELFRAAALEHRPELFVVLASWPEKRIAHWVRLLQARAIENQAYVLGVNRVGSDPYYRYSGRSLIVDFNGDVLADAGEQETFISAELDLQVLSRYRAGLPFLADGARGALNPIE